MAIVSTSTDCALKSFAFTGLTDPQRDGSQVPRQEIYVSESGTIAAPGAGNTRQHTFNILLPQNYAYTCVEASCRINGSGSDWARDQDGLWTDGEPGTPRKTVIPVVMIAQQGMAAAAPGTIMTWTLREVPKQVLVPISGSSCLFVTRAYDNTDNGGSSSFDFYARFLMYDISQAHHFEVNTPTLMR